MRIDAVEVIVTSPGRNFVTVRIITDSGIVGLGDATVNGRELAVVSYLEDHVGPILRGRDASRIEEIWHYLYRGAYWRRGPVTMAAISAIDMALWDIKAKVADMPLYQLLGGRVREGALAYAHAFGTSTEELIAAIQAKLDDGFQAVRIQSAVPGLDGVYGVPHGKSKDNNGAVEDYEPAHRSAKPIEETWNSAAYLRHVPTVFAAVREHFGFDLPLLHDAHHRLTPNEAAILGRSLEPYDLFWLEDVTPVEQQHNLRRVRSMTTTPLAIGEVFNSIHDCYHLVTEQLIDYLRVPPTHGGGITGVRKLMDFAALHQVKSGFHGPTDISPVGMAASVHLDVALHNFGIQEYMQHADVTFEVFSSDVTFANGQLNPGETPGLGVDIDTAAAREFPYEPAYLPVARLQDGTIHDW